MDGSSGEGTTIHPLGWEEGLIENYDRTPRRGTGDAQPRGPQWRPQRSRRTYHLLERWRAPSDINQPTNQLCLFTQGPGTAREDINPRATFQKRSPWAAEEIIVPLYLQQN